MNESGVQQENNVDEIDLQVKSWTSINIQISCMNLRKMNRSNTKNIWSFT